MSCVRCSASMTTTLRFTATWARVAFTAACQFDLYTAQGIEKYKRFMNEAVELVVKFRRRGFRRAR